MSPMDTILGIPSLVVQRVEHGRDIQVWACRRVSLHLCIAAIGAYKATYQHTHIHTTRQGN